MVSYIPGISASGALAPGLSAATVRAVLELLSSAEIAASYMPLAGGTLAGDLDMDAHDIIGAQTINAGSFLKGGLQLATEAYASNASNLASGIVPDERLSTNVARRDQANTFVGTVTTQAALTQHILLGTTTGSSAAHLISMRDSAGTPQSQIYHEATSHKLSLMNLENASTVLGTSGSDRLTVLGSGRVLIGTVTDDSTNMLQVNGGILCTSIAVGSGVSLVRNATGPTLETRAAGGLKVCNADGSAVAAVNALVYRFGNAGAPSIGARTDVNMVLFNDLGGNQQGTGVGASYNNGFLCGAASRVAWTSDIPASSITSIISQASAGVLQIGTTSNNALGSLNLANLTASGVVLVTGSFPYYALRPTAWGADFYFQAGVDNNAIGSGNFTAFVNPLSRSFSWVSGNPTTTGRRHLTIDASTSDAVFAGNLTASGSIRPGQFTVATLPSAAANTGRTVQVTDSSVDFPGNIGNTVAGGGANNVDVKSNGTNWRITG